MKSSSDIGRTPETLEAVLGDLTLPDAVELMCHVAQQAPRDHATSESYARKQRFVGRLIDVQSRRVVRKLNAIDAATGSTPALNQFWQKSSKTQSRDVFAGYERVAVNGRVVHVGERLSRIPVRHTCGHFELRMTHWNGEDDHKAQGFLPAGSACSTCAPQGRTPQPNYATLAEAQAAASC